MAKGDYSTVSGIKGYDELRKFIHKGSGSPKVMEWLQSLRDKKAKNPSQPGFKVNPPSNVSTVSYSPGQGGEEDGDKQGQYLKTDTKTDSKTDGVIIGERGEELQGAGVLEQEKKETFKERRDRRKERVFFRSSAKQKTLRRKN